MNVIWRIFSSIYLSIVLLLITGASILAEHEWYVSALRWAYDAERWFVRDNQQMALRNAIEQYWIDFPDAVLANNGSLAEQLAGKNPKNVRYLKVETYRRDAAGRLLDVDGDAYIIRVEGPKLYLCAPECDPETPPNGDRDHPLYRRS
jgi:hypothetical protein